jgi:hypothetical protein
MPRTVHGARHRALAQRHGVAGLDLARGLGDVAVDLHPALADFLRRQRAGLVEAGGPQPFVDAQIYPLTVF